MLTDTKIPAVFLNIPLLAIILISTTACQKKKQDANKNAEVKIAITKTDVDHFFDGPSIFESATDDFNDFAKKMDETYDKDKKSASLTQVKYMMNLTQNDADSENVGKQAYSGLKDWLHSEEFTVSEKGNYILYTVNPIKFCEDEDEEKDEGQSCEELLNKINFSIQAYRTSSSNLTLAIYVLSNKQLMKIHFSDWEFYVNLNFSTGQELISKLSDNEIQDDNLISGIMALSLKKENEGRYSFSIGTEWDINFKSGSSDDLLVDYRIPVTKKLVSMILDTKEEFFSYEMNLDEAAKFVMEKNNGTELLLNLLSSTDDDFSKLEMSVGPYSGAATILLREKKINLDFLFGSKVFELKLDDKESFSLGGKDQKPFKLKLNIDSGDDDEKLLISLLEDFSFTYKQLGPTSFIKSILSGLYVDLPVNNQGLTEDFTYIFSKGDYVANNDDQSFEGSLTISSESQNNSLTMNYKDCKVDVKRMDAEPLIADAVNRMEENCSIFVGMPKGELTVTAPSIESERSFLSYIKVEIRGKFSSDPFASPWTKDIEQHHHWNSNVLNSEKLAVGDYEIKIYKADYYDYTGKNKVEIASGSFTIEENKETILEL